MYDDNLRRVSNKGSASSDTFWINEVGIILDKKISRQEVFVDISVNKTTFNKNSDLDNNGREALGSWKWVAGSQLSGKAEIYQKKALVPFSDFGGGTGLNLRTEDRRTVDAYWRFHSNWQSHIAMIKNDVEYSATNQKIANLEEVSMEAGFDYLALTGSKIGIVYRYSDGDRPEPQRVGFAIVDNSYKQDAFKLNADWIFSGKARLEFLGGFVERRHQDLPERDYRGINLRSNLNWMATGKTSINVSVWREVNAQSFVTSSYTLNKGGALNMSLRTTDKLIFQGSLRYEELDFQGDVLFNQDRLDKNKNASLMVIYKPLKNFSMNASLMRSIRDSSIGLDFTSTAFSLTGQYEF